MAETEERANKKAFIAEYLLGSLSRWDAIADETLISELEEKLKVRRPAIKEYLEEIAGQEDGRGKRGPVRAAHVWTVSPFMTDFNHMYQVGLKLSLPQMRAAGYSTPIAFVHHLMTEAEQEPGQGERTYYVIEALAVHGAPYDLLLTVIARTGINGVADFENTVLSAYSFLETPLTWPVSYSYRYRSQDGTE